MTVIGIRYLTGYSAAADLTSRDRAEWPPHPARVFMALAAAHFETGADPGERDALKWLERQPPPKIKASNAWNRDAVTHQVPVNDENDPFQKKKNKITIHPPLQDTQLRRKRQPRKFVRAWLEDKRVFFIWPDNPNAQLKTALERLCAKVTRIGHSSSLVHVWLADNVPDDAPEQTWTPDDLAAEVKLRVTSNGLLDRLEFDYRMNRPPRIGTWRGYRRVRERAEESAPIPHSVWDPALIVRRFVAREAPSRRLSLLSTLQITQRLHEAILAQAPQPVPEFISGHKPDGTPSERTHIAFLPLAFVGSEHATGQLMGIAFALPANLTRDERLMALAAIGNLAELKLGPLGRWELVADDLGKVNLQPEIWTASPTGATHWATVTPIVFDRHPKSKTRAGRQREEAEMVRRACTRIGLPNPARIVMTPVSAHKGVPASREFPRMSRKDGSKRRHAHAIIVFDQPVVGPVALCAGRYRGYGLCRPVSKEVHA